ncbi:hypothetical protein Y1Q_0001390 [Alligator mississippiensis]|uniref:Uncharacterized protein n=1 Tax=Alligator mississippiensis TaxID=8496 RepID=A0A151M986_ALLMI|nr:hypothetical protein Y1Q_0001390 [Alligator mississippiensis]
MRSAVLVARAGPPRPPEHPARGPGQRPPPSRVLSPAPGREDGQGENKRFSGTAQTGKCSYEKGLLFFLKRKTEDVKASGFVPIQGRGQPDCPL